MLNRENSWVTGFLLSIVFFSYGSIGFAQTCANELEPNQTPKEATPISGIVCLKGTVASNDQDLFVWTLSAQDLGDKVLAFDFESVRGALSTLSLLRLDLNDAGESIQTDVLLSLTTRDGTRISKNHGTLKPGTYYLGVSTTSEATGDYTLSIRLVDATNILSDAVPLDDSLAARGPFAENGKAVFKFETTQSQLFRIQALGSGIQSLAYFDSKGVKGQVTSGASPLRLDNLALAAGEHYLELTGQDDYLVKVIGLGPVPAGSALEEPSAVDTSTMPGQNSACISEAEPNDALAEATRLVRLACFSGELGVYDKDYYTFSIAADTHQKLDLEFTLDNDVNATVSLQDNQGNELQSRYVKQRGVLADLVLQEGLYVLELSSGNDPSPYQVTFIDKGRPEAGFEQEPNDHFTRANPLDSTNSIKGRMLGEDKDTFAFEAKGEAQLWRLEALGKGIDSIALLDATGYEVVRRNGQSSYRDKTQINNMFLSPGKHYLMVQATDANYTLRAIPLGPADAAGDRPVGENELEPNDSSAKAQFIKFAVPKVGILSEGDDIDMYRFTLYAPEAMVLELSPGKGGATGARIDAIDVHYYDAQVDQPITAEVTLLPGDHYVSVHANQISDNYYQLTLKRPDATSSKQLELALAVETAEIAAYWHQGQEIIGHATVTNKSQTAQQFRLGLTSSHYAWRPKLEVNSIHLEPNESKEIPLSIRVLPDAHDDQSVRVTLQAKASDTEASATLDLNATCTTTASNVQLVWPLPQPLVGKFNVAWSGLGAKQVGELQNDSHTLFDGSVGATGWGRPIGESVTVELAGDKPVTIIGVTLNPRSAQSTLEQLKSFEVAVSNDGETFRKVLVDSLSSALTEQSFVFDDPVEAHFVKLTTLSAYTESPYKIGLGEFKVISEATSQELGIPRLNIASPDIGGHLVLTSPLLNETYELIDEGKEKHNFHFEEDQSTLTWVLGFYHDRAAQITGLEWDATVTEDIKMFESLEVLISLESPIGPWESLGTWQTAETFKLSGPKWARFVKLTARGLTPHSAYRLPDTVRVFERPTDDNYLSIVGEWGQNNRAAIYEQTTFSTNPHSTRESDDNDSLARAQTLEFDQVVSGEVIINEDIDWYKITVPQDSNTLTLNLKGAPTLRAVFDLQDSQGKAVTFEQSGSASEVKLVATVEAGDYYLKLEEPPRSVIFSWDNSGSLGSYVDIIYQSVTNFVQGVKVGREVAQMLPFSDNEKGKFLLEDWSGDPYELMTALNNYDRIDSSSSAETSLLAASRALGKRTGTRAVMFITDAETSSYKHSEALWTSLAEVQPTVFTFEVNTTNPDFSQDAMQSWADVAGGYYDYTLSAADFDVGFARASCMLRRPANYQLKAEVSNEAPPGPGGLRVVRTIENTLTSTGLPTTTPVEIILDASGSMYEKLGKETRIDIAKRVLKDLVENLLPAETPFALRIFGHKEPKSCRTDLEIPLSPLDPATVTTLLTTIKPQAFSGTPIAASLLDAVKDLKTARSNPLIILLTDGEESCHGDVESAIETLREQGIDAQLSIISFSNAEQKAKKLFQRWAELGGGQYFEAGNDKEFKEAFSQSLKPTFNVIAADGQVIASGQVNGPMITIPAGVYTVKVVTGEVFEAVAIIGQKDLELTLISH